MSSNPHDILAGIAIPFSPHSSSSLNSAVDNLLASLDFDLQLLAFGEPTHGDTPILTLRNQIFSHLVDSHHFTAIALESSFPRSRQINDYILGLIPTNYDTVQSTGFSHNFGPHKGTRDLVEWMRAHNAEAKNETKLHLYGFDGPLEMMTTDSPRELLHFALNYLTSIDGPGEHRARIDALLGDDSKWQNPAAMMDPAQSIGLSPNAIALRIEIENLIAELRTRRPELTAKSDSFRFDEALHYAHHARHLLNYHACLAKKSDTRIADALGLRDLMMADNLLYILQREQKRTSGGKVLAFAHNTHLQRGIAKWQLGPHSLTWWPAGSQVHQSLGPTFANIGCFANSWPSMGLSPSEPNTLESLFSSLAGPARFIPTEPLYGKAISPHVRGNTNPGYFPMTPQSLSDFDFLLTLDLP